MSDTPETDAAWAIWPYAGPGVYAKFARKLERERDEARKEVERLKADKARIDWMDDNYDECEFIAKGDFSTGKLREDIDSAMKGDK